ncbi:MAG: NADH-quinone oxidoreductase subunit H [bacterium]|nr:NADH-quinone oxidoreductase subunit H [bacterium]
MTLMMTLMQVLLVVGIAPFTMGCVRWYKARLQGRKGASPLLPYWTIATLFRKEMVISSTTSWVFRIVPYIVLATALFLSAVLPLVTSEALFVGQDHFLVIAGVLALGAVALVLGGLDPGSAFGGMGASREMTISALIEPAMVTTFAAFAVASGSGSMRDMLAVSGAALAVHPALLLSLLAFVLVFLAENARYPVDNPATHLELTMVHEAMVLEYSGPYLALLELAAAVKLTVFALLLSSFITPSTLVVATGSPLAVLVALVSVPVKIIVVMALLALWESTIPKMRFYRMQEYLSTAFMLALAGLVLTLIRMSSV